MKEFEDRMRSGADRIEKMVLSFLPPQTQPNKTVVEAMQYSLSAGGKRLRPMLMEETYRFFGGEDRQRIEPFMAAIEMIHTYSLIHDDLPALDDDDLRRGRPTAHKVFGEDMAILAGDALLNYAFETAMNAFDKGADEGLVKAMRLLAVKPGISGMIGGQTADVENTGKAMDYDLLMYIHRNKTAALIEASMMIGACLAGADEEETEKIGKIASNIGLAFQIEDDILDVTGSVELLGKPVGSDEKNEKTTYVTLKGMEEARADARALTNEALHLYDSMEGRSNPFLRELIGWLCNRRN